MDSTQNHNELVDSWIKQNATGLPSDQLLHLFGKALEALQKRTLKTLSDVTLNAILDRVLYQSQQRFSFLTEMKIDSEKISLDGVMLKAKGLKTSEITEAFRFFLIEFLTILENLTAGVLTKPLHETLTQVKANTDTSPQDAETNPKNSTQLKPRRNHGEEV